MPGSPRRRGSAEGTTPAETAAPTRGAGSPTKRRPFEYAIVWVVPRVERGERFNAGIVLHSRPHGFLGARTHLDETLLRALAPDCDPDLVRPHLDAIARIAAGDKTAGPIAHLSTAERCGTSTAPTTASSRH